MYRSRLQRLLSILAPVALGALTLAATFDAAAVAGNCPNAKALGNFEALAGVDATFSSSAGVTTYSFDGSGLTSADGSLIEYCVYTTPLPDSAAVDPDILTVAGVNWDTDLSGTGDFGFGRSTGSDNIPFGLAALTIGTATWNSGSAPTNQIVLLHVNDPVACNTLYGGNPGTCFVFPGGIPELPDQIDISGVKYYDVNTDGQDDNGESGIQSFEITIQPLDASMGNPSGPAIVVTTASDGTWGPVSLDTGTYYQVCETLPTGTWQQTGPLDGATTSSSIDGKASGGCWYGQANNVTTDLNFGNVCLGNGGGLTLGFWSNRNGQALINNPTGSYSGLQYVNSLSLAGPNGILPFLPPPPPNTYFAYSSTGYSAFRTWILGATATNMANMLSAQMAAMNLNINIGGASGSGLLFAGSNPTGCSVPVNVNGYISASALVQDASTEVGNDPYTLSGNPDRTCQEFKKNALDAGNNNKNWVQPPSACAVVYPTQ
jgi:hypothetical protein